MAAAPYFVASIAALKSQLRLSGAAASDFDAIFDAAVKSARLDFYRRLGADRLAQIKATGSTDDPSTGDQYMRMLADQTEVLIVRKHLLVTLPVRFLDGSADANQVWSDEAPFRDTSVKEREAEVSRLSDEIEQNMNFLEGDETSPEEGTIHAFTVEPDCTPPRIGQSLWGTYEACATSEEGS